MSYKNKNKKIHVDFCHSREIYPANLLVLLRSTWLAVLKTGYKKLFHETVEAAGEFIENKITDKNVKLKPMSNINSRNVEEIVIQIDIRQEILN